MSTAIIGLIICNGLILVVLMILYYKAVYDRTYLNAECEHLWIAFNAVIEQFPPPTRVEILRKVRKKIEESGRGKLEPDPSPESGITRDDIPPGGQLS